MRSAFRDWAAERRSFPENGPRPPSRTPAEQGRGGLSADQISRPAGARMMAAADYLEGKSNVLKLVGWRFARLRLSNEVPLAGRFGFTIGGGNGRAGGVQAPRTGSGAAPSPSGGRALLAKADKIRDGIFGGELTTPFQLEGSVDLWMCRPLPPLGHRFWTTGTSGSDRLRCRRPVARPVRSTVTILAQGLSDGLRRSARADAGATGRGRAGCGQPRAADGAARSGNASAPFRPFITPLSIRLRSRLAQAAPGAVIGGEGGGAFSADTRSYSERPPK